MTQIQHVTAKEMTRRTGVRNALGYTFPEKDLILLRKGLTGKLKREVLDHEMDHLEKGEEGPFAWGLAIPAIASVGSALLGKSGAERAAGAYSNAANAAIERLRPYTEFGYEQLDQLKNYLAGPRSPFAPISVEDVMQSPEYGAGLETMQSSAAARGGLKSGNFLRRISEELAPMGIERERQRRLQELQARNALLQTGYNAATAGANVATGAAPGIAGAQMDRYGAMQGLMSDVAGLAGQYQQQKNWEDFLTQYNAPTTPYPAGSVPAGYQVGPVMG